LISKISGNKEDFPKNGKDSDRLQEHFFQIARTLLGMENRCVLYRKSSKTLSAFRETV